MAHVAADTSVTPVVAPADIMRARATVEDIFMDDKIKDYIVDLVFATREPEAYKLNLKQYIQYGASPRATLYLTLASKAHAFISGRGYVTPQDVKSIGLDVLRHRVIVSYEAEAEDKTADQIVQSIFDAIEVP
jgi:MoxR-like ATPase